ncbi:MAG TPA: hypothetical protein VF053_20970 [Streptosporangiales bacterium]
MGTDLHSFTLAALVISVVIILLVRASRLIGDLIFLGVILGGAVGVAGIALATHLV